MATYEKEYILGHGSARAFAQKADCWRLYESDAGFHTINSPAEDAEVKTSPYITNLKLVWQRGDETTLQHEAASRKVASAERLTSDTPMSKTPGPINETIINLYDAASIFFETILPFHEAISVDGAENEISGLARAAHPNPEYVLRAPSLGSLKRSILSKLDKWNDDQRIEKYIVSNVDGFGNISNWATFETQCRNSENRIQRMGPIVIGAVRRRVIWVWKTPDEYIAWSGAPWPNVSLRIPEAVPSSPVKISNKPQTKEPSKRWWQFWLK